MVKLNNTDPSSQKIYNKLNLNNKAGKNDIVPKLKGIKFKASCSATGNEAIKSPAVNKVFNTAMTPLKMFGSCIIAGVNKIYEGGEWTGGKIGDFFANKGLKILVPQNETGKVAEFYKKLSNKDLGTGLMFLVLTQALKDFFSAYLYVRADLNNKNIPKEKRIYQAALDGVNGICTVGLQILCGLAITSDSAQKKIIGLFGNNALENKVLTKNIKLFSTLGLTAVVAKRLIAYVISTPLASEAKNWSFLNKGKKPQPAKPETEGSKNSSDNNSPVLPLLPVRTLEERLAEANK